MKNKLSRIIYNKIKDKRIIKWKYLKYSIIIRTLLSINLFILLLSNDIYYFLKQKYSLITLKIRGVGNKNIFSDVFLDYYYPHEVYINENRQNNIKSNYKFNQSNNIVKLKWNYGIQRASKMFYNCVDITEIDLSKFDTSYIEYMDEMFYSCSSLTSVNFFKSNNLKLFSIARMFYKCISLTSLDLSDCDTSNLIYMNQMFYGCKNLEYINMKNFNELKLFISSTDNKNIFKEIPDNIVICINEDITKNKIFPQIKDKTCYRKDCSNDWKSVQQKIINSNGECIPSCKNSGKYIYINIIIGVMKIAKMDIF